MVAASPMVMFRLGRKRPSPTPEISRTPEAFSPEPPTV